jgi:hypothetical protein
MRDFYLSEELPVYQRARTFRGFVQGMATKLGMTFQFFFGALLLIPLAMLPRVFPDHRGRFLMLTGTVFFLGVLANAFSVPHYFSPATSLLYAVLIMAIRHLITWRPGGQPVGRSLARVVIFLSTLSCLVHLALMPAASAAGLPRVRLQQELENHPGPQLAIVRYAPKHDPASMEWVYNAADIDAAKVVWAREMSPEQDRELVEYYRNRKVWLVEPDQTPPRVTPYALNPKSQPPSKDYAR